MASVAKPIHHNIPGAPFHIGALVRVVRVLDETTSRKWIGRLAKVRYYEYSCGCGQAYPDDPMIGVRFRDGSTEEFWRNELEEVSA